MRVWNLIKAIWRVHVAYWGMSDLFRTHPGSHGRLWQYVLLWARGLAKLGSLLRERRKKITNSHRHDVP